MDTKQDRAVNKRERQQSIAQARRNKEQRRNYENGTFADFTVAYRVKKGK